MRVFSLVASVVPLGALLALVVVSAPVARARAAPAGEGGAPVLVELFTSEGCSSCPPADAVVGRLGAPAITLAFHVDYWNELGWPDPFSSADATARQRSYGALRGGTYTPQAVVDGATQVVGSRAAEIDQAVADAAKRPHAVVDASARSVDGAFEIAIRVGGLPAGVTDAELLVATVQDRARVVVARGENAGHTLDHTAVVRSLVALGPVSRDGASRSTRLTPPPAKLAPDGSTFSAVVFVQERGSRRVLGAKRVGL